MIVQQTGNSIAAYANAASLAARRQMPASSSAENSARVSISDAARAMAASPAASGEDAAIQRRLATIEAKPSVERTDEERQFVRDNDKHFAEIAAKPLNQRTAEDIDYMQKATGFVNTMAYLSDAEKQLYNEMVAKGDMEAAKGLGLVAMTRIGGQSATLADGTSFNPSKTEITAANVRRLFSQLVVDPSGDAKRGFDALANFLEKRVTATA